jgi:hypothetical protein
VLNTAAKLAIADHLAAGPCSSATLTRVLGIHPEALHRFLRLMVVLELLAEEANGGFALTPLGRLLRADHPESMRDLILYWGPDQLSDRAGDRALGQDRRPGIRQGFWCVVL